MNYPKIYERACRQGKLRKDEYTVTDFLDDTNDLGRLLWTTIFQGVNGNKPVATRKETIVVAGNLTHAHPRVIQNTPITKIVQDDWTEVTQHTDKTRDIGETTFEYDDEEIRFRNSADATYTVFYEAGAYEEVTQVMYDALESPNWLKDDFHPVFWAYAAFSNSDTRKDEMFGVYSQFRSDFETYYARTETIEENCVVAEDTYKQL